MMMKEAACIKHLKNVPTVWDTVHQSLQMTDSISGQKAHYSLQGESLPCPLLPGHVSLSFQCSLFISWKRS